MNQDLLQDIVRQVLGEMKLESEAVNNVYEYGIFADMNEAINESEKAQKKLLECSVEQRNDFANAIRKEILKKDNLEMISRDAVDETGIGCFEDKIIKNRVAAQRTPGMEDLCTKAVTGKDGIMIEEYCPFGVIGAITPTTNPTETIINNSISMIVGGNTVVFSPHPRAKNVSIKLVKMINKALEEANAPRNLVTMVATPSIENTNLMMSNPKIRLLVATGGPAIVKTVLSSGKKAIGAGAGNPPVVVDETADIEKAAKDIVSGASFDNNVPCIAEKEVFAVEEICDKLIYFMKKNGAYEIVSEEIVDKLDKLVSQENGKPKTEFVGKSAKYILSKLGIYTDSDIKLIICRTNKNHHFVREEMLMPILPVVSVSDVDIAIDYAYEAEGGNRHTAVMHSKNVDKLSKMAKKLEATIFVKNAPSYSGIGVGGEGHTTFTIAGPTGEGITSAKSFCRIRRCVMKDAFSIR